MKGFRTYKVKMFGQEWECIVEKKTKDINFVEIRVESNGETRYYSSAWTGKNAAISAICYAYDSRGKEYGYLGQTIEENIKRRFEANYQRALEQGD